MNSYPLQAHAMPHQLPHDTHRHALPPPMGADAYPQNPPPPSHMPHGHLPPMTAQGPPAGYEGYPPGHPPEMSADKKPTAEELANTHDALVPKTRTDGGRRYVLEVVQQPKRARMCGFGDKDRRPITPPPCVRLVVTDAQTGKEIDCNDIEHTMYVLSVDLWSEDAMKEVNLVRHSTATPSISSTTPASFAAIAEAGPGYANILPSRDPGYPPHQMGFPAHIYSPYAQGPPGYMAQPNGYPPPNQYYPQAGDYGRSDMHAGMGGMPMQGQPTMASPVAYGPPRVFPHPSEMNMSQRISSLQSNQPQGMFTRNIIGSLAASAFRLTDPAEKIGIWFIMQDISVRTEGNFRLRFSFVNVGPTSSASPNGSHAGQGGTSSILNTGKAPVLASCFSDVFTVYSAKKFPGVCESTGLSKCFATQGIKIPIRKEGANSKDDEDDY